MNKKIFRYVTLLTFFVSACGTQATPTISGGDVQNTAVVAALTYVVETQDVLPTNTFTPSTEFPTETQVPSPTMELLLASATDIPTFTPQPSATSGNPCNKPLLTWQGETTYFSIANETNPKGKITLLMSVATKYGECGYLHIYSDSFSGPAGSYSAAAFVDGKRNFKVFGAFQVTEGSWRVVVRNDTIVAKGSCYPNC